LYAGLPVDQESQLIGVDVGGTGLKMGRFNYGGELLAELNRPTPSPASPELICDQLIVMIEEIDPEHQAIAVGIGIPGPIDKTGRIARICINLPGWIDVPLANWLEPKLQRPVVLGNDGNCAVYGEQWQGAGKNFEDIVLLTLGTGVGGGVIIAGQLFLGCNGAAAEPGLIGVDPNGPACNSGNNGSLESFCSISALTTAAGCAPAELSKRAGQGDLEALAAWHNYGLLLGCGVSSLIYCFTPQRLLIGGGLSAAFPYFGPALKDEVTRRVLAPSREGLEIMPAALGNGAGRLGAARLARSHFP
jgi:glucokinase